MKGRTAAANHRPSVLFVISHDLAPRHGCYGGQAVTPHIDALADEGVRFDNHFCHWPLCGPSRANLFTGCRPLTTRRFDNDPFFPQFRARMGAGFMSLPQRFREAGYTAAGAGLIYHDVHDEPSWDTPLWRPAELTPAAARHPDLPRSLVVGENKEWVGDAAYALIRQRWDQLQRQGCTEADLADPSIARRAQGPAVEIADGDDEVYSDGAVTSRVIERLRAMPVDRPFFLAAGLVTGHTPFRAPCCYWEMYDRKKLRLPRYTQPPHDSPEWASGDSEPAQYYTTHGYERPWRASTKQSRELLHAHLASMSYCDAQVGRLLAALKSSGRYDDTIVVVISDHGYHDGQHGYWGKHNLWDQSLRTALVMRIPGVRPAALSGLTAHVDVYPTLCELCGLSIPDFVEGESFVRLLANPAAPGRAAVFAHRRHMWHDRIQAYHFAHSVRTERYRYTEYIDENQLPIHRELFDYDTDPEERDNHVDALRNSAEVKRLQTLLREFTGRSQILSPPP